MVRANFRRLAFWALALTLTLIPMKRSESQSNGKTVYDPASGKTYALPDSEKMMCQIHLLADLCGDPQVGKWIADTIPQVIEPGSWSQDGNGKSTLTYNANTKILVIYHTPAVQAKIGAFLENLRKVTQAGGKGTQSPLMPAQYVIPSTVATGGAESITPNGYPVPAVKTPKHLFHFIIRYEGEGIVDSNVVEALKVQLGIMQKADASNATETLKPTASYQSVGPPSFTCPPAGMMCPPGAFPTTGPGSYGALPASNISTTGGLPPGVTSPNGQFPGYSQQSFNWPPAVPKMTLVEEGQPAAAQSQQPAATGSGLLPPTPLPAAGSGN